MFNNIHKSLTVAIKFTWKVKICFSPFLTIINKAGNLAAYLSDKKNMNTDESYSQNVMILFELHYRDKAYQSISFKLLHCYPW